MAGTYNLKPVMNYETPQFTPSVAGNTQKFGYDIKGNQPPPPPPPPPRAVMPELMQPQQIGPIDYGIFQPSGHPAEHKQNFDLGRKSTRAPNESLPGEAAPGAAEEAAAEGAAAGEVGDIAAMAALL